MAKPDDTAPPDPAAWLDEFGNHLYGYALYRVRNPHLAEDLVQETLLSAWKGYSNFEGRSSAKTWLTRILHNKIIDHIRKDSRERLIFSDEDLEMQNADEYNGAGGINPLYGARPWSMRPDQAADSVEFWKVLRHCIDGLPPTTGEVFVQREIDGLSSDEICKLNGITPNNFWVILHRARKGLRKCLEINWFGKT